MYWTESQLHLFIPDKSSILIFLRIWMICHTARILALSLLNLKYIYASGHWELLLLHSPQQTALIFINAILSQICRITGMSWLINKYVNLSFCWKSFNKFKICAWKVDFSKLTHFLIQENPTMKSLNSD